MALVALREYLSGGGLPRPSTQPLDPLGAADFRPHTSESFLGDSEPTEFRPTAEEDIFTASRRRNNVIPLRQFMASNATVPSTSPFALSNATRFPGAPIRSIAAGAPTQPDQSQQDLREGLGFARMGLGAGQVAGVPGAGAASNLAGIPLTLMSNQPDALKALNVGKATLGTVADLGKIQALRKLLGIGAGGATVAPALTAAIPGTAAAGGALAAPAVVSAAETALASGAPLVAPEIAAMIPSTAAAGGSVAAGAGAEAASAITAAADGVSALGVAGGAAGIAGGALSIYQGVKSENTLQTTAGALSTAAGIAAMIPGGQAVALVLGIAALAAGGGSMLTGGPTFAQRQKMIQGVNKGDLQQVGFGLGSLGAVASEASSPEELQFLAENNKRFFPNLDTGSAQKMATGGANVAAMRNSRVAQLLAQAQLPQYTKFSLPATAWSPEELAAQQGQPPEKADPLFWIQPEQVAQWRKTFNIPEDQRLGFDALRQLYERDRVRSLVEQQQLEGRLNALGGSLSSPALSGASGGYEGRTFSTVDDYITYLEQARANQDRPDH